MIKLLKTTNKARDMCEVLSHDRKPLCLEYSAEAMEKKCNQAFILRKDKTIISFIHTKLFLKSFFFFPSLSTFEMKSISIRAIFLLHTCVSSQFYVVFENNKAKLLLGSYNTCIITQEGQ